MIRMPDETIDARMHRMSGSNKVQPVDEAASSALRCEMWRVAGRHDR